VVHDASWGVFTVNGCGDTSLVALLAPLSRFVLPNLLPGRADGAPPSDEARANYTMPSEQYMFDLSDYEDWAADEAHSAQIILGSMKAEFAMDLTSLPSTLVMWERATELYQSKSYALHLHLGACQLHSIAGLLRRRLLPSVD
jgi:hypothetical protein